MFREYMTVLSYGLVVMFALAWMDLFVAWIIGSLTAYAMLIVKYKWFREG